MTSERHQDVCWNELGLMEDAHEAIVDAMARSKVVLDRLEDDPGMRARVPAAVVRLHHDTVRWAESCGRIYLASCQVDRTRGGPVAAWLVRRRLRRSRRYLEHAARELHGSETLRAAWEVE